MMPTIRLIVALIAIVALGGCNLIYKQAIQQGNAMDPDDLRQLELGMNKRQVSLIMGTPAIHDPFHLDRWDYVYTFNYRGRMIEDHRITLLFEDGTLNAIEGDLDEILKADEEASSQG